MLNYDNFNQEFLDLTCHSILFYSETKQQVETELQHDTMHEVMVDGYQGPGTYIRPITYKTNLTQIDQLIYRASSCRQFIQYRCENSRLLDNPGTGGNVPAGGVAEDGTGTGKYVISNSDSLLY